MNIAVTTERGVMMKRCTGLMCLMLSVSFMLGCENDSDRKSSDASEPVEATNPQPSMLDPAYRTRSYTYRVIVLNIRNQPVPGALVLMETQGYGSVRRATTSANGVAEFNFSVPGNTMFAIVADSTGYRSASINGRTGANLESVHYLTLADL